MTSARKLWAVALPLVLGTAILASDALAAPHVRRVPPVGRWSEGCAPGFRLSAMPTAWTVGPGQPVTLVTRLAVDFDVLPEEQYSVARAADPGERVHHLIGFSTVLLRAEVRRAGEAEPVATVDGVRLAAVGHEPALLTWNGLDAKGEPVPPGVYEIEVRGRLLPAWARASIDEDATYADLAGWSAVAEACTRSVRVEVVDQPVADVVRASRTRTCADPPSSYYSTVNSSSAANLRSTLHPIIDDHTRFPYTSSSTDTWDVLSDADEHPTNTAQILDAYKNTTFADGCSSSCTWNREHSWAKSYGFPAETGSGRYPYTDAHHLRATEMTYNSARGNKPLDWCSSGCTSYATVANAGYGGGSGDVNKSIGGSIANGSTPTASQTWEVWNHRKGDLARSILYMDIRYEGDSGTLGTEPNLIATSTRSQMLTGASYQQTAYHGVLSTLLDWHDADPPDADEIRRNNQVWCYQGNRNPFVDHPEWVSCLYRGTGCGGGDTTAPTTSITAPTVGSTVSGTVSVTASASDAVGVTKVEFYLDGALQSTDTASPYAWSWNTTTATNASHSLQSKAYDAANNVGSSSTVSVTVNNTTPDTTAPVTSITAPTAGSTVSGTISVTASATDAVGVTKVEFYLDGALKSTDTASPYAWSWDTTTATNASHSLQSKAYDAANNVGTSTTVSVTVSNGGGGTALDVGGWKLTQANSTYNYTIPAGTTIPANGYLVVGRSATQAAFQTAWGVTLGSNVVYLNSAGSMPVINGSETYTLANASGTVIDGATIAMFSSASQSVRRNDPCQAAGSTSSWTTGAISTATPGTGAGAGCGKGVVINEFADATSYVNEFVELHYDAPSGGDTTAPTTSITAPAAGATVSGTYSVTASASDAVGVTKVEFYLDGALKSTDTTSPYAWSWDTTTATNASHSLQSKAYDAAGNVGSSATVSVTVSNGGSVVDQTAAYDSTLKAPKCATVGKSCTTGSSLVLGRGTKGPEPNYSNTIAASCADGTSGTYHVDESLDGLKVKTSDGTALARGKTVTVEATVYAYSTYSSDYLDLYYAPDASSPSWTLIGTVQPTAGGTQVLTRTYTIPSGGTALQAIRGQFRYGGSAGTCTTGSYNDRDDLVFAVQ